MVFSIVINDFSKDICEKIEKEIDFLCKVELISPGFKKKTPKDERPGDLTKIYLTSIYR